MERDFLGLGSKVSSVKEETGDGCKDSAILKGSGMQWSFSNKVSAPPQFLSFKAASEDRPRKTVYDPLVSSGFVPMSTADAFDSNHKPLPGSVQKNLILDNKQGGSHYALTAYPLQHFDAHSAHHSHEVRTFPVSNQPNQTISVAMSTPILQSHITSTGQKVVGSTINTPPLGGIPIITPVSFFPGAGSNTVTTDLRNALRPSGAPAQLTIFYAGSVNVYDDISPEKAQAIMLLAGNGHGPSVAPITTLPLAQVQAPNPRPSTADVFIGNQPHTSSPCSGLPSPISVTSHAGPQSGGVSAVTNEIEALKLKGTLASPINQPEPPAVVNALGSAAATMIPSAVPQARKASLARFLEKRKERAISTLPYNVSKNSLDCSIHGSDGVSLSMNSAGCNPLPAVN